MRFSLLLAIVLCLSFCPTWGPTVTWTQPSSVSPFDEQKTIPLERGPASFWAEPTKTSAQHKYFMNRPPRPGGLVPESRRLSMLQKSFCPRSSPHPVKGRSQSLALRWTQLQNWSHHNCRRCRHSSPHNQEAGPLVIRCLHNVHPSI